MKKYFCRDAWRHGIGAFDETNVWGDSKNQRDWFYFQVESIDEIIEVLTGRDEIIEINPETFYGRKEVVFKDINGLQVTFSCEPDKK